MEQAVAKQVTWQSGNKWPLHAVLVDWVRPPQSGARGRGRRSVGGRHLARLCTGASLPALHALLMLAQGGGNGALGGNVLSKPCSCNITLLSLPTTRFFRSGRSYAALVSSGLLIPSHNIQDLALARDFSGSNVRSPGPEAVPPPAILAQPPALGEDTGRPAAAAACSAASLCARVRSASSF